MAAQSPQRIAILGLGLALCGAGAGCGSASGSQQESYGSTALSPGGGTTPPQEGESPSWPDPSTPGEDGPGSEPGSDAAAYPGSGDPPDSGAQNPGTGDTPGSDDLDACASDTVSAARVPLDLFMLVDKSGSMAESTWGGTKWQAQSNAIAAFVDHPQSAGIGIGLQFFPWNDCYGYPLCDVFSYATPEVPIGALPGQAAQIKSSIASQYPEGGTPTLSALTGALQYMSIWAGAHPGHMSAVVLATDGEPTECSILNNVLGVASLASTYASKNPPVLTFVIGVGSSLFSLNSIASSGGTGQAFIIDTQQDVTQQFVDALNMIQNSVACQFQIPVPAQGTPDYDEVNVRYIPAGGAPVVVPGVGDPNACGANEGWFYDNPAAPSKIVLCAATCDALRTYQDVSVEIVLGCETVRDGVK